MYTPTTREKKLEALLDASKILNTSQDSDEILKSLLELSLDLIEGGDAGCIFLYNPTSKLLEMFAYVGMGDAVKQARLKPGESMTGLCFINNTPMFFDGGDVVQQTMGTMTQENVDIAMQGNVRADKIYGSICCPLLHHEESLGVLVIDNFSNQAPLTESDVEVLTAISVQATIAIINARNYEKELANNRKLEEYNRIIENQRDLYQLSTQVHSRFVDMVLKGSTIDDIIQDVKQLTGKDILIIDFVHNITSHTFGATLPAEIEKIQPLLSKRLSRHSKRSFYNASTRRYYFIFPIVVNREPLSWLCLISDQSPLSENNVIAAERSATIIALELLKQNELNDLEQSIKGDFLDGLISGENLSYVTKYSESYNFNPESPHRILLLDFSFKDRDDVNTQDYEKNMRNCINHFYKLFSTFLTDAYPGSVALIRHHQIVCILDPNLDNEPNSLLEFVKTEYHENYENVFRDLEIRIGISDLIDSVTAYRDAYENVKHTLNLINKKNTAPIQWLYFKDIHIKRFLLGNDTKELKQFVDSTLGPLTNYNNASKEDFLNTLRVYIRSNGNWSYTKDELHIHGNTLTYRLSRIEEILHLDLNNYQDRLRLQITFEILELFA
ncbi:MAG: hypothetical protein PWQ12_505 [Clostridiales bacterium]|nr:hypothetical protein [Clostridiales bacterium]